MNDATDSGNLESTTSGAAEPGAVDNRLSLDPNNPGWKKLLDGWEDGGEYEITLKVSQLSPGEFEVSEVSGESESPEEDAAPEEEAEPATPPKRKINKAVMGMMEGE